MNPSHEHGRDFLLWVMLILSSLIDLLPEKWSIRNQHLPLSGRYFCIYLKRDFPLGLIMPFWSGIMNNSLS